MFRPCKYIDKAAEHDLEAALPVLRRQIWDRRLLSDHEFQFGNEVHDELTVRTERLTQCVTPAAKLRLALSQQGPDQTLECLGEGGVRDVALVLVELAGCEEAGGRDQRLVQLVDNRGLANAGIAGDEYELRCAIRNDPVEGGQQSLDLMLPAVELLRYEQTVRCVVSAEPASRPPGTTGVSGAGTICVLTFQAKAAGGTSITMTRSGAMTSKQQQVQAGPAQVDVVVK